jgi:hypothetical protein
MNPTLPKTKLCIKDLSEGNKRKGEGNLAKLKYRLGIAKRGRAG